MGFLSILVIWMCVFDPQKYMLLYGAYNPVISWKYLLVLWIVISVMSGGFAFLAAKLKVYDVKYKISRWYGVSSGWNVLEISLDAIVLHMLALLFSFIIMDTVLQQGYFTWGRNLSIRSDGSLIYWVKAFLLLVVSSTIAVVFTLAWQELKYNRQLIRRKSG